MAGREKKGTPRVAAKSGEEVAQGAGGVAEAGGGLEQGELIDADGAEGPVLAVVGVCRLEEI